VEPPNRVEGDTVQDHVVPPLVEPTTEGSLADLPARNAARNPANVLFARKAGERWVDVTAREFHDDVRRLAKGLVAAGVQPGDRVAIMGKTRYEWTLADFSVWTAGGVAVPIYETSSAEQVHWILEDSGAVAIVLETHAHAAIVDEVRDQLPQLKHVWQIEGGGLDELTQTGTSVSDAELDASREGVDRTSVATIIYTSGTTGRPKGCQLTHDNFMALSDNAIKRLEQVLPESNILLDAKCGDWKEGIRLAAAPLLESGSITEQYIRAIENSVIANGAYFVFCPGVALAHAGPGDGVKRFEISFARLHTPVCFGHRTNDPVRYIICFGSTNSPEDANLILKLMNIISTEGMLEQLDSYEDRTLLYQHIIGG
jgi:mannitol/fructose-specific phosphotransferase system IIA component (Ntr-type)